MKGKEASVFIFTASLILGVLISSNMNFSNDNDEIFLTPLEYQEAYDYTRKLNKDIDDLFEKYYENYAKLENYKSNQNNKNDVLLQLSSEIENNEVILGKADVEGEGITISLSDASDEMQSEVVDPNDYWARTVHDTDIVNVINELKVAGAEVISLNGNRITDWSSILCWGVFIELDGVKIPGPYEIKAIGNKEKLYSYMVGEGGYLSFLKIRGIRINIMKQDNISILASNDNFDYKYMNPVDQINAN